MYDGFRRRAEDRMTQDERNELNESFMQCPRFDKHELTDDQIEEIAERAAKKAIALARDGFYQDVGETIVGKFKWLLGAVIVGSFMWLASKGFIKL